MGEEVSTSIHKRNVQGCPERDKYHKEFTYEVEYTEDGQLLRSNCRNKLEYLDKRLEDVKAELLNWHDGMNMQEENLDDVIVRQLDDDNRGKNTTVFDPFVTRSRDVHGVINTNHDANFAKIM
ncbi:hypothetical protein Pint_18781 [Pistacia integerrima]|uniref:Uncharacterized protein n=1 Tax=Pistacia integerrima TaxID=434235 RepID=A0ACC0Z1V9_9ROSI|nr:hypothetical protein Pint_18781 [Pistacia integerrima]